MNSSLNSSHRSSGGSKSVTFAADESIFNNEINFTVNKTNPSRGILKRPRSRSKRAGIHFPARKMQLRRAVFPKRIGDEVPIFLAAVLQYLVAEVMSLAGIVAEIETRSTIEPTHLQTVIRNDKVLFNLLTGGEIAKTTISEIP